jgi:hypothetical protein
MYSSTRSKTIDVDDLTQQESEDFYYNYRVVRKQEDVLDTYRKSPCMWLSSLGVAVKLTHTTSLPGATSRT